MTSGACVKGGRLCRIHIYKCEYGILLDIFPTLCDAHPEMITGLRNIMIHEH